MNESISPQEQNLAETPKDPNSSEAQSVVSPDEYGIEQASKKLNELYREGRELTTKEYKSKLEKHRESLYNEADKSLKPDRKQEVSELILNYHKKFSEDYFKYDNNITYEDFKALQEEFSAVESWFRRFNEIEQIQNIERVAIEENNIINALELTLDSFIKNAEKHLDSENDEVYDLKDLKDILGNQVSADQLKEHLFLKPNSIKNFLDIFAIYILKKEPQDLYKELEEKIPDCASLAQVFEYSPEVKKRIS